MKGGRTELSSSGIKVKRNRTYLVLPSVSFGEQPNNEKGANIYIYYSSVSIEIDAIDVSNLQRFSSRRNRIGLNRTNVTKWAVQWEFEYTFFALTLIPM